jgi:hypothetical protein
MCVSCRVSSKRERPSESDNQCGKPETEKESEEHESEEIEDRGTEQDESKTHEEKRPIRSNDVVSRP